MALPKAVQAVKDQVEAAEKEATQQQQPVPAVQAVPDPAPAQVEPNQGDDWEKRFKGLVTTHQQTKQQLEQAQATMAANQQTIATLQQQVSQLMQSNAQPAPAAEQQPSAQPSGDDLEAGFKAYYDRLPQNIKDDYTEEYLRDQYVMRVAAEPAPAPQAPAPEIEQRLGSLEQRQEKSDAEKYEEAMDAAYPDDKWIKMTSGGDERWAAFCNQRISPVDERTYGQIVATASQAHDSASVIWVLKEYEKTLDPEPSPGSMTEPLAGHLTPEGDAGGGNAIQAITPQTQTFSTAQITKFYSDVAMGGKYTVEEAAQIEAQIQAAQQAGTIVQ